MFRKLVVDENQAGVNYELHYLYGRLIGTVISQYEVEGLVPLARWYRGNTSWLSLLLNQDFFI